MLCLLLCWFQSLFRELLVYFNFKASQSVTQSAKQLEKITLKKSNHFHFIHARHHNFNVLAIWTRNHPHHQCNMYIYYIPCTLKRRQGLVLEKYFCYIHFVIKACTFVLQKKTKVIYRLMVNWWKNVMIIKMAMMIWWRFKRHGKKLQ